MCLSDLRSDVETEPESLSAVPDIASEKRFEKLFHRALWNRNACVRNPKLEHAAFSPGSHAHRLVGRAMCQCIADEVRDQLAYSGAVAVYRIQNGEAALDAAFRRGCTEFVDDLLQYGLKRPAGFAAKCDAAAEATAGEIENDKHGTRDAVIEFRRTKCRNNHTPCWSG